MSMLIFTAEKTAQCYDTRRNSHHNHAEAPNINDGPSRTSQPASRNSS